MTHPQDLSLVEQARAVAGGELDPHELLSDTLARIEERDPPLNAVVARFPAESERMLAGAPDGPLHGVPIALKDMYRLPWRAPRDATHREQLPPGESGMYRRLRDAGAVVVGVTNMHWGGAGTTGAISAYGAVGNPWDPARCGGGSSGGSAAAVGARLAAGAVGNDGGGSVRLPAAYCGVTGLKLTYGTTPRDGYTHRRLSVSEAGPLCRDAADARLLAEALAGAPLPAGEGGDLRVGIVRSPFLENLDPAAEAACSLALAAAGWKIHELSLPGAGHTTIATVLHLGCELLPEADPEELEHAEPLMRAIGKYQFLLGARDFVSAQRVRALLRDSAARAFERCDLLAWPTVPAPAPPIDNPTLELPGGNSPADPANVRQAGLANLTGIPAISVPAGAHPNGMPLGLQLAAPWGRDSVLLDAAEHLERATARQFVDAVAPIAQPAPA